MSKGVDIKFKSEYESTGSDAAIKGAIAVRDKVAEAGEELRQTGINIGSVSAVASGNLNAITKLIVGVCNKLGILKNMSVAAFGALGGAIMSVLRLLRECKNLIDITFNTRQDSSFTAASETMLDIKNATEQFANRLKEARAEADALTKSFNAELDVLTKMEKLQLSINRTKALSAAETKEEKDAINAAYELAQQNLDTDAAAAKLKRQRNDLDAEELRIKSEIAEAEKIIKPARNEAEVLRLRGDAMRGNGFSGLVFGDQDKARNLYNQATQLRNAADEAEDKIEDAKKRLEELNRQREILDKQIAANELAAEANAEAAAAKEQERIQAGYDERNKVEEAANKEMEKQAEDERKKREDELKKAADERAAVEKRAAEEMERDIYKEKIKSLKKAHDERMKQLDKEKDKAEEQAKLWEEAAKRARDFSKQKGGFGNWMREASDLDRAEDREKDNAKRNLDLATKERDRLLATQARGKGFDTQATRDRLEWLDTYIRSQDPKNNPYLKESERIAAAQLSEAKNLNAKVDDITKQMSAIGL